MNFALLHRADRLYGVPEFVKQADFLEPEQLDELSTECFLDPVRRLYPVHTKAAAWLSSVDYFEKVAAGETEPNPLISRGLQQAAQVYGIQKDVRDLLTKLASDAGKYTAELPDSTYAMVITAGGQKNRFWPLLDVQTVKAAAAGLYKDRSRFPLEKRAAAAAKILAKADEVEIIHKVGEEWEYLEKAAGVSTPSLAGISDAFMLRGLYLHDKDSEVQTSMVKLAQDMRTLVRNGVAANTEMVKKAAAMLDTVDRQTGLFREYGHGLPLPEEQMYGIGKDSLEKQASGGGSIVCLTTGNQWSKDQLEKAAVEALTLLPEYKDAMTTSGQFDFDKAAAVLPTIPRDDAQLFEQALQAASV